MNKKVTSLVAVGIFLMSATPAFAAFRWGFSFDIGPFHFGDETTQTTPALFPSITPFPSGQPDEFFPSHTVRPTRPELSVSPRPSRMPRPSSVRSESGSMGASAPLRERTENERYTGSRGATGVMPSEGVSNNGDVNRIEAMQSSISKMYDGYQKRIGQYESFVAKLKTRRDKMVAESQDTMTLDSQITEAEADVAQAKETLQEAVNVVKAIDFTADPNEIRAQVLGQSQKVKDALETVYKDSQQVVESVKTRQARPSMSISPRPSRMIPSGRPVKEYENRRQTVSPTP